MEPAAGDRPAGMSRDARLAWLGEKVCDGLQALPVAFDRLLEEPGSCELLMRLVDNEMDGANPTVLFYATHMEEAHARLLAGKLVAPEQEPEPEPEPEPAQAVDAAAPGDADAGARADATAKGGAPAEGAGEGGEGAASDAAAGEGDAPEAGDADGAADASEPPSPPAPREPPALLPAELLQLHVCVPSALPDAACKGGLVYFTLMVNELIPSASDAADLDAAMNIALDRGVITGGSLAVLEQVVDEVYVPLLSAPRAGTSDETGAGGGGGGGGQSEFVSNVQKFGSQITHAIQQLTGDVRLNVPQIEITDPVAAAGDEELVAVLEVSLEEWTPAIAAAVEAQMKKTPVGNGPLAEIEFWRSRSAALSTLCEQLNTPNSRRMLEVLERCDSQLLPGFLFQFGELEKRYVEAKDNVKFLTTLERHFKNITHGSLLQIVDTLPSLMSALRMVWVISRHYKEDHRMEPLMARIAWEIANTVSGMVHVRSLFRDNLSAAIKLITEAKAVLDKWEGSYMEMRARIEDSGRDNRWEFDRHKLFSRTRYMSARCADLLTVAEMLRDMRSMLGPELTAVTGNAAGIMEVTIRVEAAVAPLESAPFDLFDRRYFTSWEAAMTKFRDNVAHIEDMVKRFMDDSFLKLRTAEDTYNLLQKFKEIQDANAAGQKLMESKSMDILQQYDVEIEAVRALFTQHQHAPPVCKNQPPVAGAINWAHALFLRIRRTIARIKPMGELESTEQGQAVSKKFVAVSKEIRRYEQRLFEEWSAGVNARAMALLKAPIFVAVLDGKDVAPDEATAALGRGAAIKINFHSDLSVLVRESKYLDRMGFAVPETALNVTLQEAKYHGYVESLHAMLAAYNEVLGSLSPVELELLASCMGQMRAALDKGFTLLNWNSLSIPEFTDSCMKSIARFNAVVKTVAKNAGIIGGVVLAIGSAELVRAPDMEGEMPELSELYDDAEKHRQAQIDELVRQYHQIGPLLVKVEEMVVNTSTGFSPALAAYYAHWERELFGALNKMVTKALARLLELLSPREALTSSDAAGAARPPLFRVSAILAAPEVIVSPPLAEVNKLLSKLVRSIVESTRSFVRWMHGSCLETPPQQLGEDDEPVIFSYFSDVSANPEVRGLAAITTRAFERTFGRVNKQLDQYRKYDQLWKVDKAQHLAKFEQKAPTCVMFDSRLQSYSKVVDDARAMQPELEVDFMRISVRPLLESIEYHAGSWIGGITKLMNDMTRNELVEMHELVVDFGGSLERQPDTLEDLKFILNLVTEIAARSMDIELQYTELEERYRTLRMYGYDVPDDEADMVDNLRASWESLCWKAKVRDRSLSVVKKEFTLVTAAQVSEFQKAVVELHSDFVQHGPGAAGVELDAGLELVAKHTAALAQSLKQREELGTAQKLFNLPIQGYPELSEVEATLRDLAAIYDTYRDMRDARTEWSSTLWSELDIGALERGMEEYESRLRRMPKAQRALRPFRMVEEVVTGFTQSLPLISLLKNEALRPRHWSTLMDKTGVQFDMDPRKFSLGQLFDMNLDRFEPEINEIVSGAVKELNIERGLHEIADTWKGKEFVVVKYLKGAQERGLVLRSTDEISQTLEDQTMNLSSMMSSKFVAPFAAETSKWEKAMSVISEVIEVWMKVQSKWMYLEAIFIGSEDIRLQLPEEAKRFDRIHTAFKKIMDETAKKANVLEACTTDGRLDALATLFSQLEACQKSLSDYLETKRTAFPRFYFLSDDELLQILGTSDPTAVQEHMLKLFDNTAALTFDRSGSKVLGMVSSEKESFSFNTIRLTEGAVETWLSGIEAEMLETLRRVMKEATFTYPKTDRIEWLKNELGMVVNTGAQIWWTFEVNDVFDKVRKGDKMGMKNFAAKNHAQLNDLIVAIRDPGLSKTATKRINTLVIIDVHARDIIDKFVRDSVLDEREFAWESQLRFYWDRAADDVLIRQCSGQFLFGYEYQGLNGRLVITPLTDRCYMTCTQALHYRLGCAPAGPAGTGKTETVKDLSKAMALQCKVFCCGEGLDFKAMGSIFSGLVQTGAWGCFDEFNRIPVEVLSVVSAQIKTIQTALADGLRRFTFEGREINLMSTIGVFITMNPGYAGRTELPDNLKALFRPVVMVTPDLAMICENMLMSEGFGQAKMLAKKMTVLYALAEAQLSKQYHYDFKLRALKSVLVMAGGLKRASPEFDESTILMRALRDMNMPKFVYADVPLFRGLIGDLFPGLDCPRVRYPDFNDAVEAALREAGYQQLEIQVDKVIQLYETLMTRHTTMIVGPTGGGKTVALNTLARAQTSLNLPTKMFVINPKSINIDELYGVLDPATRDWTDGLLSNIFRDMNRPVPEGKEERRYIVYDGDVDALWVENMNSVMDDNKLLTLPNGERIRLNFPTCSMLFEVYDLQYASPATISRCGMVYVDPKDIGWKPFLWKWLNTRDNEAERDILSGLFTHYLDRCVDFVCEGIIDRKTMEMVEPLRQVTPMTNLALIEQLTKMLASMLTAERNISEKPVIEACFFLAVTWSLGGALVQAARIEFDRFLKKLSGMPLADRGDSIGTGQLPNGLPTLHDYMFDLNTRAWRPWTGGVDAYVPPADGKFSSIMVPTADTVRSTWLVDSIMSLEGQGRSCALLVGDSGTAKTTVIARYLLNREPATSTSLTINFSSRTSSKDVQIAIEDVLEKRTKDTYGPPAGKKLIVYVDDLNMPKVDTYGTQQPVALLKLLVDRGYLYDRGRDLSIKYMKDMQFVAAMVPGRNEVDPRFTRLFNVFFIAFPPESSIKQIYASILQTFFDTGAFDRSVQGAGFAEKLTSCVFDVFNAIVQALPPTPAKFHYIFNLRDLSRVTEGVMLSTPDKMAGCGSVVRLLRHEMNRIFYDRLVDDTDKAFVTDKIADALRSAFSNEAEDALREPCVYGDLLNYNIVQDEKERGGGETLRLYEDMGSYGRIKPVLEEVLEKYNSDNKAMNLVLFEDCLGHLVRVHRLMRLPRGNALLVGVGGSGKQSITRLAAYTADCDVFSITLTRGYNETLFRDDLKQLYGKLQTQSTAFMFTDAHVAEEGSLELINNMLTSGMVPALFEESERDGICNNMRDEAVNKGGALDTKESIWQYFIGKCRDNLHVVMAMSPVGEQLRVRCRSFPGMVNNTVIDWFVPWPEEALESVAGVFLAEEDLPAPSRKPIVEHMVMVHQYVRGQSDGFLQQLKRYNYVTPKNYLDFISNYRSVLKDERRKIDGQIQRLDGGLSKLVQAATEVDAMQVKLVAAQAEVEVKSRQVKEMLVEISANTKVAEQQQAAANTKEQELNVMAAQIVEEKAEAEAALEEALPALEDAANALNGLKKEDITEMRQFAKPHELVQNVALCVVILKGGKDVSWKGAKVVMGEGNFLRSLVEFDKDGLTEKQIKQVKVYFQNADFTPEAMKNISQAGAGLLKWVYAIVNYYGIAKTVNPKRQAVANAEKTLRQAQKDLIKIQAEVKALGDQLKELQVKFEAGSAEERELQERADLMERRLTAASKLIVGLSSERERWTSDMEKLHSSRDFLVGDCLLASAFLSYTGAFSFDFRANMMVGTWEPDVRAKKIPCIEPYRLETLLTSEVETAKWASEGLPQDELSIQNGILTTRSSRYPLCIDPQQQAVSWVKKKESKSSLKVCSFHDADFLKHLEICVNLGFSYLFEGVDEYIDPIIDPVLEKNIVRRGASRTVKIGDKDVEWDDSFRLYLTSKLANPHYGPETFGKVMVINYSVTLQGLEDQLLNETVKVERSDLAEQQAALVEEVSELSGMLKELEDTLLYELANSSGNILDNTELIETLEKTKLKATEISEKLEEAKSTSAEISDTCQAYRPVAKRGSILFFVMASLSILNNMYELSLALYMVVFLQALRRADPDGILENRLENIICTLTLSCYSYSCRGIFETHKLMFSFEMALQIMRGEGELDVAYLDFFLKGNLSLEKAADPPPGDGFLSEQGWHDMQRLVALGDEFSSLPADVRAAVGEWRAWYDLEAPESSPMPQGYADKLSALGKMMVLRCFRVDRIYVAITKFVIGVMGEKYVQPPVLDFPAVFQASDPMVPVIFVLSPGADPASDIFKLANKLGMGGPKMKFMALGQGQGPVAQSMLEVGSQRGHWVMLQNCHLLPSWLKTLEKLLEQLHSPHADFRLWLTTDPTDKFPIGILQRSLKVVTEPPNGLRLNMLASYSKVSEEVLTACPHPAFRSCVFVLAFFHAVVQERRKYGKIGWNVRYDFNDSDFAVSLRLVSTYLEKAHENGDAQIPWDTLRYLVGEVMYGGRVTDNCDRRVVATYMNEYLGDFLFDSFQPFHFYHGDGSDYRIPQQQSREACVAEIDGMPGIEAQTPEVFGLHPNAEIDYLTNSSKKLWRDLLDLQPRTASGGGGITREDYITSIASDLESKLPKPFDLNKLRQALEADGFSPVFVVLVQELERWEILNTRMSRSLAALKKALVGEIAMSMELDGLGTNLFNGQLPDMWRKLTPATDKMLGSWVVFHLRRQAQYAAWVKAGEPKVIWLSGLSIPETYTAALVQTTCRKYGWPLDKSSLYTKVTSYTSAAQIDEKPADGCYVEGLYLEGAAWDVERRTLVRQPPKVLVQELPIMQIIPVELSKLRLQGTIRVPLYITQQRRNAMGVGMMMEADVDTRVHDSHWVLQGVALVMNTDQ
jgi:dynein heavy chain